MAGSSSHSASFSE
ncbi:hypothetical protein A2U01_0113868, partial [Trifolium medium]|nr:hypothetical protein [Trifolium medium]